MFIGQENEHTGFPNEQKTFLRNMMAIVTPCSCGWGYLTAALILLDTEEQAYVPLLVHYVNRLIDLLQVNL